MTLRVRWLETVPVSEGFAVQQALVGHGCDDHVPLAAHPRVFTHGSGAKGTESTDGT